MYSYGKQITDWVKTAAYYLDNLDKMGDELLAMTGVSDAITAFNDIIEIYKEFSDLYKDIDEFQNQVLKDPQGFLIANPFKNSILTKI